MTTAMMRTPKTTMTTEAMPTRKTTIRLTLSRTTSSLSSRRPATTRPDIATSLLMSRFGGTTPSPARSGWCTRAWPLGTLADRSAVMGAFLNGQINAGEVEDKVWMNDVVTRGEEIQQKAVAAERGILEIVNSKM